MGGKRKKHSARGALASRSNDHLVVEHKWLVERVVTNVLRRLPSSRSLENDDLVQAGMLGLLDAARRYKPRLGAFKRYAEFKIRKALIDELRHYDPVKRHVRKHIREVKKEEVRLFSLLGRQPKEEELAAHLGLKLSDFRKYQSQWRDVYTVTFEVGGQMMDTRIPIPEDVAIFRETAGILRSKIGRLSKKLYTVLHSYYFKGMTFRQIGEMFNVTESRAHQMHTEAIFELKKRLEKYDMVLK